MESLPLVPGYTFRDPTIQDYKLKQKFGYFNGFRVVRDSNIGIGRRLIDTASSAFSSHPDPVEYDPSLTYGRVREYGYPQVIPNYVLFAQKCLNFKGFFRQGVFNSPNEHFRIRHVNIIYFLEDDTMSVMERPVDNSGLQQGRLVRRGKILKNTRGDAYTWKDLNVGINLSIYGVVYHTVDCDTFTREFLCSQGIDVGDKEEAPPDPYTQLRQSKSKAPSRLTPVSDDSRRRFLEYDTMVLKFEATWNNDYYQILYFLTDDTIAIREIHQLNDGKDPTTMLLKRTKVPKNWKGMPSTYPSIYMECGDPEVTEYYTPTDLRIGDTIFIFGRRFFLFDCDPFTRKYYSGMLGLVQPEKIQPPTEEPKTLPEYVPPPHIKFGTPEDTLAGCLSMLPKSPKKDVIRQIFNFPKKLRYSMKMDAVHPEDENRDFILEYNLNDGSMQISEPEKRNSGRRGGTFLSTMLVPKPGTNRDNPLYYTPEDFYIGAKINCFNHRFVINGADLYVYRYIKANPEKFCEELRDNMRNYFVRQGLIQDEIDSTSKRIQEEADRKRDLDPTIGSPFKDDFDTAPCVKQFAEQALHKYEGEHGEYRPPTPPPEELCPGLTKVEEPLPLENYCPLQKQEKSKQVLTQTKKQLKWADQIHRDKGGHPIISCQKELPECKTHIAQECVPPHYFKDRDRRFEVGQLMYEKASSPAKPDIPPSQPLFNRETGERTITMLHDKCRGPYPPI
ncbi:EF-hand domain-containing protein 1 isoform X1 [Neodiprion pinetum]|uniref:EF-hand domain-containing protein 1 isoform X1 n=2 Tax=Neodiprion pinetum TaxID=441929 RepID=UPI001EDD2DAE|nr:EF-hand domain-containing protein 1-like isoform X1 [Neodiprion pinetum]